MPTDSLAPRRNSREKRNSFSEVSEAEKKLWKRIHSDGILDKDVKELYRTACCIYEKLFLSDNELPDLQNFEYLLWRLHYKHIDEFRRTISQSSAKVEDNLALNSKTAANEMNAVEVHMEGFRVFLSEATKFYQNLIRKIKRYYNLLDEPWYYKNDGVSGRIDQTKMHKCQFICHRLCICLGDLARYLEVYEKLNVHQRNWSVAASYYLEAAKIYPDGGNPHNQLAVLATYIGDEFLALYHCIRSLAVKEPFPDSLRNLMLLFGRNRSCNIASLSNEVGVYDFCKPSDWISIPSNGPPNDKTTSSNALKVDEHDPSATSDLWTLFIRLCSCFFLESSLDDFTCTFTSTLRELEAILALNVAELSSALQSYQNLKLLKAGPYRSLHIVSVLIFIFYNLRDDPERKILKAKDEGQQSMLVNLTLTVTFTFMGRLAERCLKGSPVVYFPLLPALLVFVEWLMSAVEELDAGNDKCEKAGGYFFGTFVDLLNHLQENRIQITSPEQRALWEDYELRGFLPLCSSHEKLDFSSHWEYEINYRMKNEYRAHRIVQAAIKIASRSSGKWLLFDEAAKKFSAVEAKEPDYNKDTIPDVKEEEPQQQINNGKSTALEEEEDIVFKPIARHNSEPITFKVGPVTAASDEHLRRASSLLIAQNRALAESLISCPATPAASSSKQTGQNESRPRGSIPSPVTEAPMAAGPPSLSSWVLYGDRLSCDRANSSNTGRNVLTSIPEVSSDDLRSASISISEDGFGITPPATCAPNNVDWLTGALADLGLETATTHETPVFASSSNHSVIHQGVPEVPHFMDHSSPSVEAPDFRAGSNSEFLNAGNHSPQREYNRAIQDQYSTHTNFSNVYGSGALGFGLLDHWSYNDPLASLPARYLEGTPPLFHPSPSLLHGLHNQRRDKQVHYQKPHPYVSPAVPDTRPPYPQPLLLYLKHRECQLQKESQFTGSYMQN